MRFVLAVSAMMMASTVPLHAEDAAAPCDAAETQSELNECQAKALAGSDRTLNELYRSVESRLADNASGRDLLVQAQRRWIAFRDAECAFEASAVEGGSMQPMIRSMCLKTLTDARVEDLRRLLSCEEGDTSCPVPPA